MGENIFDPIISGLGSKGGVSSPFFPKIQALPGWGGGGSDPCLDFFERWINLIWAMPGTYGPAFPPKGIKDSIIWE